MKEYYAREIAHLRELGAEFARNHPTVAPLLAARSTDPDVERILEGTAFLCGLIHERLDQNFPEIARSLLEITAPGMLLPQPSECIVQFTPSPDAPGVQEVAAGAQLRSAPVNGASCTYSMCADLQVLPVAACRTSLERLENGRGTLRVRLACPGGAEAWLGDSLTFFLHGELGRACDWMWRLLSRTSGITVTSGGGRARLPAGAVSAVLPPAAPPFATPHAPAGTSLLDCGLLRKFFIQPEEFLFVRLDGLSRCGCRGDALEIAFALSGIDEHVPDPDADLFRPSTGIAVNLFPHAADPFVISHARQDYRLRPRNDAAQELEIYAVTRVTGVQRGGGRRSYQPYRAFARDRGGAAYALRRTTSSGSGRFEYHLGLLHARPEDIWDNETLATEMLCYNRTLPRRLHVGDISVATDSTPLMARFANILPPSPPFPPPADSDMLWRLFSCAHANMLPLATADALKEFLRLCLPPDDPDPAHAVRNNERIAAIRRFSCRQEERLVDGRPVRGQRLELVLGRGGFSGPGEMHLFGSVLDGVLAGFATINTYTRLVITDGDKGERHQWPARLGSRRLL